MYRRHIYQTRTGEGEKAFVYLLDEAMGMEKIGLISANLAEKIAEAATESPYRVAAGQVSSTSGQGAWNLMQKIKIGERISQEEGQAVHEMESGQSTGKKETAGANNLAKSLYRKENGELPETIERFSDGQVLSGMVKETVKTLSAAKAPKKDGKGDPYPDTVRAHMPLRDAIQTAARKALLAAFN